MSVEPFSNLHLFKSDFFLSKGAVIDTNVLIAATYEPHELNEEVIEFLDSVSDAEVPLYCTVTVRAEFIDFARRTMITEKLMDVLSNVKLYKIANRVRDVLRKHKTWIDLEASRGNLPVLNDYRIKECKIVFDPQKHSGQMGWIDFCKHYLANRCTQVWEDIDEKLGLNYLQLRKVEVEQTHLKKSIDWKDMYVVLEKTGISSSDAMIINAFLTSNFGAIFTADYDVAYAIAAENLSDKICFVPDSLYKKVKKLKF